MAVLEDKQVKQLKDLFKQIKKDVRILLFTKSAGAECEHCQITEDLLGELPPLNKKLTLEKFVEGEAAEAFAEYGIDKLPAIAVLGDKDYGIRFFGTPAGYEFTSFVQALIHVGKRDHGLSKKVMAEIGKIDKPVHLQVMISPQCPYCPTAVLTAHRFAMASDHIRGDMVETFEFQDLAEKYGVGGVPDTVINEDHRMIGALTELDTAYHILMAIGEDVPENVRDALMLAQTQAREPEDEHEHHVHEEHTHRHPHSHGDEVHDHVHTHIHDHEHDPEGEI